MDNILTKTSRHAFGFCMCCPGSKADSFPIYELEENNRKKEYCIFLHPKCDRIVFKKIKEYVYENKVPVTWETVSLATGLDQKNALKVIKYYGYTGDLEIIENNDINIEDAEEMKNERDEARGETVTDVRQSLSTGEVKKKIIVDDNSQTEAKTPSQAYRSSLWRR